MQELVQEKETRIRETMLMMGLQQWILWSTWYLKQLLFLLFSVIIITILVKVSLCSFERTKYYNVCDFTGRRSVCREQYSPNIHLFSLLFALHDIFWLSCQVSSGNAQIV